DPRRAAEPQWHVNQRQFGHAMTPISVLPGSLQPKSLPSMRTRRNSRGFTLIELLVALFIAAVMFAMGYGAINQALTTRGSIRRHQENLVQLEMAMRIMEQDFVQLAPRP